MSMSNKKKEFNNFRFAELNWYEASNKYISMNRVSEDENKIVVKVGSSHLLQTKFGYALILDESHVVFLKSWQVSENYFGNEVLLTREFFNVKEWGDFSLEFSSIPENLSFDHWLECAKAQDALVDEDGMKLNRVKWEF